MTNGDKSEKKITLEESLRRIKPLFIMMMMFPLIGMIAAMVILYMIRPKNLLLMEVMIVLSMILYIVTTYLFINRMGRVGQEKKPLESQLNQ